MVHCRPVVEVSRSRPLVGTATVTPLNSMVIRRVVKAMAITTHHLRLRSVTRGILNLPGFRLRVSPPSTSKLTLTLRGYERRAENYLGFVRLACVVILIDR